MSSLKLGVGVALVILVAAPAFAQSNKRVDFVGDVSADATTAV